MSLKQNTKRLIQRINNNNIDSYSIPTEYLSTIPSDKVDRGDLLKTSHKSYAVDYKFNLKPWDYNIINLKIYYITDLHLLHKLIQNRYNSKESIIQYIDLVVSKIIRLFGDVILIGGDISSDITLFVLTIKRINRALRKVKNPPIIIFTLGNHELWELSNSPFDKIVENYRELIEKNGMYLLQNDILFMNSDRKVHRINSEEIGILTEEEIRTRLRRSVFTIFGGLAFSGYEEKYNADFGLYRDTIDRATEIRETKIFEALYQKVVKSIPNKKVIIFTHMPVQSWSKNCNYHNNYIYVNGHTHSNFSYDNGEIRIYADNQIGYYGKQFSLKRFSLDCKYDYFADYSDGIYKITKDDYLEFFQGMNVSVNFNRNVNCLYMLKKKGYYCFISKSMNNSLCILNGGALKKLSESNIDYYFNNMDSVIAAIKNPLTKYTALQNRISEEIKKIGGSGLIHGCIVDIDFYNHIYVNPNDLKITGYWAPDMINKKVYPDVLSLLKQECPLLYKRFNEKYIDQSKEFPILINEMNNKNDTSTAIYLETDIYEASRIIKKMQRIYSNILTTWPSEDIQENNLLASVPIMIEKKPEFLKPDSDRILREYFPELYE